MPLDKFVDMESVSEERRKAIRGSLEIMSLVDLQQLLKELSDFEGDPSRENLVSAIEAHPEASFYRAVTQEGAIILYCPGDETAVWFLPGSGMGSLPEEAKRHMREAMHGSPWQKTNRTLGRYGRSNAARTQYGAINRSYGGTLSVASGPKKHHFAKRRNKALTTNPTNTYAIR